MVDRVEAIGQQGGLALAGGGLVLVVASVFLVIATRGPHPIEIEIHWKLIGLQIRLKKAESKAPVDAEENPVNDKGAP